MKTTLHTEYDKTPDHRRVSSRRRTGVVTGATALVLALGVTGCASDPGTDDDAATSPGPEIETIADSNAGIDVADPWIKATDSTMTSVFGHITNHTDHDLAVVSASADIAGLVELHEMVEGDDGMIMQEIDGGFELGAGQRLELDPGGNHIMLMDLQEPILPGETFEIELEFDDGSAFTLEAIAKEFVGANEEYAHDH